jgi:hypothetical protein
MTVNTSKPVFTSNTSVYNTNAITYFDGYCSLATYGGSRVHAEYVYPDGSTQAEYIESNEWMKQGAKLRYDHQTDTYYLHVSVKQEREDSSEKPRTKQFSASIGTWTGILQSPAQALSSEMLTCSTTTRRGISHTSSSRIGASLVLEGRPITSP